ncbi:SDR family NAD(P)-dependent oxidoreductase [Ottowia thiooxydans]|uniref:SDR family NAD(P)-dependent oxidoreductase n=1 Tax=Ottowia thiooxydans TaxID=219182 RepID=UPI00040E97A9|nr:SDR family NAD(P)-dependent oxidoreductase [Ottowia thiooxydans]
MIQYDFSGQTAIITGAASGVGLHTARRLHDSGARISLWDIDAAALSRAAQELGSGDRVDTRVVDVCQKESILVATREVLKRWARIDILINNAGIIRPPSVLAEVSLKDWQDVLDINLTGTFLCCQAVIPHMAEVGYGRVVNIGSTSGKEGNPFTPAYSAAKAGVMAMTKSLAKEFAKQGVLVNCVAPTVLDTPMTRRNIEIAPERTQKLLEKIPMGRFGQVDELATMLLWLSSSECSFSTGAVFDLSGGRATY